MIVHVSLLMKEPVYFRSVDDGSFIRISAIDRRLPEGLEEYPRCDATPVGVRVLRRGCFAKLIPWHVVVGVDFFGELEIDRGSPSAASAPPTHTRK